MANLPTAKRKAPVYFKALPSLLLLTIGFCANAQIPNFSSVTNLLEVPYVLIDGAPFNAKLNRETDGRFSIQSYAPTASIPNAQNVAKFTSTTGNLTLPLVTVDGQAYSGSARLDVDNRLTVTGVGVSPLGGGLYGLQSGAEVRASLAYPQTGSTASFAQAGPQGIYADGRRTVIIDASNYMVGYELYTSSYDFGTVIADGNTWTLGPGGTYVSGGFYGANAGSGTFSPKGSLAGNTKGIGFLRFDLPYDSANALAVSLPSLSGVWTASFGSKGTLSVSINPDGSFSGQVVSSSSFVICTVSGTVSQKEPGSFKNMFSLSLSASGGLGCPLQIMTTYQGAGAILYSPVGDFVGNGYRRGLTFFAKTPGGTTLVVPFFRK
jgi:hypothetical protein